MRVPLIERLDPAEPTLAAYDASAPDMDTRRASARTRAPETRKGLERRMRRYFEWCGEQRYQKDPQFVTPECAREYTLWMTTVKRYAPSTIYGALLALEEYAEGAGEFVSFGPARGLLARYRKGIKPQVG